MQHNKSIDRLLYFLLATALLLRVPVTASAQTTYSPSYATTPGSSSVNVTYYNPQTTTNMGLPASISNATVSYYPSQNAYFGTLDMLTISNSKVKITLPEGSPGFKIQNLIVDNNSTVIIEGLDIHFDGPSSPLSGNYQVHPNFTSMVYVGHNSKLILNAARDVSMLFKNVVVADNSKFSVYAKNSVVGEYGGIWVGKRAYLYTPDDYGLNSSLIPLNPSDRSICQIMAGYQIVSTGASYTTNANSTLHMYSGYISNYWWGTKASAYPNKKANLDGKVFAPARGIHLNGRTWGMGVSLTYGDVAATITYSALSPADAAAIIASKFAVNESGFAVEDIQSLFKFSSKGTVDWSYNFDDLDVRYITSECFGTGCGSARIYNGTAAGSGIPEPGEVPLIYPMPFQDVLHVKLNLSEQSPVSVELFDLNGKRLLEKSFGTQEAGSHEFQIDQLASLPPGTFLLCIQSEHSRRHMTVVKQ